MAATKQAEHAEISVPEKRKAFRWSDEMIDNLVQCITNFKTTMIFKGLDFDGDKPFLYAEIRKAMAEIYECEDIQLFGAVKMKTLSQDELESYSQEELTRIRKEIKHFNSFIAKGKQRVQEKIKEIRQSFSKALVSGTRSGSGKIVYAHFDALKQIWGGSASVEPLNFGVDTSMTNDVFDSEKKMSTVSSETADTEVISSTLNLCASDYEENDEISEVDFCDNIANLELPTNVAIQKKNETVESTKSLKRTSIVPKLVDNKRKHLEKSLSAAQRDKVLLDEAKEDAMFRKDIARAMEESNKTFAESVAKLGASIETLSNGMCKSMEKLAQAMCFQANTAMPSMKLPVNQNTFYQNISPPLHAQGFYTNLMQNDQIQPGHFKN